MSNYYYEMISEDLVASLSERLQRGESLMLLGPRNVGKRYLTSRLWDRLGREAEGIFDRALVFFRGGVEVDVDSGRRLGPTVDVDGTIDWVRNRLKAAKAAGSGRVVLFAHNVDSQANTQVRDFFKQLQELATTAPETGLAVVLTGEVDLSEFIRDPAPPFLNCPRYVLRGFDFEGYSRFARQYLAALGIPPTFDSRGLIKYAYGRTGRSTSFLRFLLWEVFDRRTETLPTSDGEAIRPTPASLWHDLVGPGAVDFTTIFNFKLETIGETLADYYFRYVAGLIDANPNSWADLEQLICGETVDVSTNAAPHPLELIGVAERRRGRLILPETLIGDYIRARYTPRRFGDLFARHAQRSSDWDQAFERYDCVENPVERIRPYRLEDVADTDDMVKGLSTELFRAAGRGPEQVLERFATGCRKALGFAEVTRWRSCNEEPVVELGRAEKWGAWELVRGYGCDDADTSTTCHIEVLLRVDRAASDDGILADEPQEDCVVAVDLPTGHPDVRETVLVGRPGHATIRSQARKKYTRRLSRDFRVAYERALTAQGLYRQSEFRRVLTVIANDLVGRLGKDLTHPGKVIDTAAEQLREQTDYGRVIFAVVDPLRRWMTPVAFKYDDSPRYPNRPMDHTVYPLADRIGGRQPSGSSWVISSRKCLVTRNAASDQRVVQAVAEHLKIRAATIVPLLDARERVVGTLHVERRDGLATTADEAEDLMAFGRRLAVALELTELGQALLESLRAVDEPLILFSPERRALYVSQAAVRRFAWTDDLRPLEPGLIFGEESPSLDELRVQDPDADRASLVDLDERIRGVVEKVFKGEPSAEERVRVGSPDKVSATQYEIGATRLWDWRAHSNKNLKGSDAGACVLLRLRPLRSGESIPLTLGGLLKAETPQEVLHRTLATIEQLGFRWGRLYRAEGDRLVSVEGFGFASGDREAAERFHRGAYIIDPPAEEARWEAWSCFSAGQPVLYVHDPERPDREIDTTATGVVRRNCREPRCPEGLHKRAGEHWIDFPLIGRSCRYGKISIGCDADLSREAFDDLSTICHVAGELLDSVTQRQSQREQVAQLYEGALSRGLHCAAAEVNRWFAEVSPAMTRYAAARARLVKTLPTDADLVLVRKACDDTTAANERVSEALRDIWRRVQFDPKSNFRAIPTDLGALLSELEKCLPDSAHVKTRLSGSPRAELNAAAFYEALAASVRLGTRGMSNVSVTAEGFDRNNHEWLRLTVSGGDALVNLLDTPLRTCPDPTRTGEFLTVAALLETHGGEARLELGSQTRVILELPRSADELSVR